MNAGFGEIQAHCELFSKKNEIKRITKTERGREKRQRDSKKRFKVTGHHLEATQNCCFVPSCCSLSTIDDQK